MSLTPAGLMDAAEARLWAWLSARANPFMGGARLAAERFGLDLELAADGVAELGGQYARVDTVAADPRRFALASAEDRKAGAPALLLRVEPWGPATEDVVALALKPGSRRFWRWTVGADALGEMRPDAAGVLRLRQEAHGYVASLLKAAAWSRRARDEAEAAHAKRVLQAKAETGVASFAAVAARPVEDPLRAAYVAGLRAAGALRDEVAERYRLACAAPEGALVLDPLMVPWTRAGALKDAEAVEIVDAPVSGPLGRALMKLNPRFNTSRGPRLTGVEPVRPAATRRRAA